MKEYKQVTVCGSHVIVIHQGTLFFFNQLFVCHQAPLRTLDTHFDQQQQKKGQL